MPEEFDPEWEYFEPDPEIAEVLVSHSRVSLAEMVFGGVRPGEDQGASGFRFGVGNPDAPRGKVAPLTSRDVEQVYKAIQRDHIHYHVRCEGCGGYFLPDKNSRKYCSNECYIRLGAARILEDIPCTTCGKVFRPRESGRKYCSVPCSQARPGKGPTPKVDDLQFKQMYLSGTPMLEIANAFGVQLAQCKRVRRRLGLRPRGPRGSERLDDKE
jgi:hypothetical protein